jgi:hypothetical protein
MIAILGSPAALNAVPEPETAIMPPQRRLMSPTAANSSQRPRGQGIADNEKSQQKGQPAMTIHDQLLKLQAAAFCLS